MSEVQPLVSIVIPVYNQRVDFFRACVESAINQTYQNLEIIISDNHSTNEIPELINEYCKLDSRIKKIKPDQHLTLSNHFLFALKKSTGKYLSSLSSDDILQKEAIASLVPGMEDNPKTIYGHGIIERLEKDNYINPSGEHNLNLITGVYTIDNVWKRLAAFGYIWFVGMLVRTDRFIELLAENEDICYRITYTFDILFTLMALNNKGEFYYISKKLALVRAENDTRAHRFIPYLNDLKIINNYIEQVYETKYGSEEIRYRRKLFYSDICIICFNEYMLKRCSKETFMEALAIIKEDLNSFQSFFCSKYTYHFYIFYLRTLYVLNRKARAAIRSILKRLKIL